MAECAEQDLIESGADGGHVDLSQGLKFSCSLKAFARNYNAKRPGPG
jgi:hypothetical protein